MPTTSASSADLIYDMDRWWVREWQKIQPENDLYRYYRLTLQQNLWGEWELIKSWGRIGRKPTRTVRIGIAGPDSAAAMAEEVAKVRRRRQYLFIDG
ncbi:MAG: WGR domain-containing protein [Acidithiobacillus sp.]